MRSQMVLLACLALAACGGKVTGDTGSPVNGAPNVGSAPSVGSSTDNPSVDEQPPDDSTSTTTTSGGSAGSGAVTGAAGSGVTFVDAGVSSGFGGSSGTSVGSGCADLRRNDSPCITCNGPAQGWQCVTCGNPSTAGTVGPEGGTITYTDWAGTKDGVPFSLMIPPGALAVRTTITVSEDIVPPAAFAPTTRGYKVEPLGLTFALPVAMHVPWGEFAGGSGKSFAIYTAADICSEPSRLPDSYVNAGFLQGTTKRLGVFFGGNPL